MGKLTLAQEALTTPSAGFGRSGFDTGNEEWCQRLPSGLFKMDFSKAISATIASHSADTYYGLGLRLPSFSMQVGMMFAWKFYATKGGGTAAPIFTVKIGPNQTTADTTRITLTGSAQTAVADSAEIEVIVSVRSVQAAGQLHGIMRMQHRLAVTGFATVDPAGFQMIQNLPATFDNSALSGQYIGLAVNPGASGAWVVEQAIGRCWC